MVGEEVTIRWMGRRYMYQGNGWGGGNRAMDGEEVTIRWMGGGNKEIDGEEVTG